MANVKIPDLPLNDALTDDDLLVVEQSNGTKKVPLGSVIPDGGTAGQLLAKDSATDYDLEWIDAPQSLPSGGTTGQILCKASDDDYDVSWQNISISLLKVLYPIGAVYMTTDQNTNPADIITGTTWTLISNVALASEHIFGNGYNLGLTNGTLLKGLGSTANNDNQLVLNAQAYGVLSPNSSSGGGGAGILNSNGIGIPTKTQLSTHPEYSGIIADTITVYMWERTA